MTFNHKNFAVDGRHFNESLPRIHSYATEDSQADVNTEGYFNDVAGRVSAGDLILARVDTDGTPATVWLTVLSNNGSTVDVSDGAAVDVADAD